MPRIGDKEYTRDEIRDFKEMFKTFDTEENQNVPWSKRFIEPNELIAYAKRDGYEMSDEEAKKLIDSVDINHDGKVSLKEFIRGFDKLFGLQEEGEEE